MGKRPSHLRLVKVGETDEEKIVAESAGDGLWPLTWIGVGLYKKVVARIKRAALRSGLSWTDILNRAFTAHFELDVEDAIQGGRQFFIRDPRTGQIGVVVFSADGLDIQVVDPKTGEPSALGLR